MTRFTLLSTLVALILVGCAPSVPPAATTPAAPSTPSVEAESSSNTGVEIVGVWTYAVASPGGGDEGTFTIAGDPGAYEGEIIAQGEPLPLQTVSLDGSTLSFQFQVGNGPVVICSGDIQDGAFNGTANAGQFGVFPMTATRESSSR